MRARARVREEEKMEIIEKDVEGYLRNQVRQKLGGLALKFISPGQSGVPDRIVLLPGARIVFVETKAPKKTPRALQKWVASVLRQFGFDVRCIDTKAKVREFIREFQEVKSDAVHTP